MKARIIIEFEDEDDWTLKELKLYAEDAAGMLWAENNFKGAFTGDAELVEANQ